MQPSNTELILIRVTGEDRPGLTASVTEILAKYDATILDIGQADIHNTLSLGILFKSEERHSGFIMKELLFKASSLGVTIRFEPITTEQYDNWVGMQGKNRYILTVLGRKLSARQISAATSILAEQGMNIDAIKRLTGRIPLDECQTDTRTRACIEFSVRGTPKDRIAMQEKLMKLASELEMDFSFQQDNMYRRMRRLICFDMDSTLIDFAIEKGFGGIVIEALGRGNVPPRMVEGIKRALDNKMPIVVVSRCFEGRVHESYGYEGGGKMLKDLGVIFGDTLPGQKARVKLSLAINSNISYDEIKNQF